MDCTATSILDATRCLSASLWPSQALASWALSTCSGGLPPSPGDVITTDPDGLVITDEDGNIILTD